MPKNTLTIYPISHKEQVNKKGGILIARLKTCPPICCPVATPVMRGVSHQKGIDMKLDSRLEGVVIIYSGKSMKLLDRRIDIGDEAQLSFEGAAFYVKITQINGDKYKGTIIKAGFDPKVHPNLGVNNDIEFEEDNIFCIGKTGV